MNVSENWGVLSDHRQAFFKAARRGNLAIAVRATNPTSLRHIGMGYAVAKRIDCKAKTADTSFHAPRGGEIPGGLVADPSLAGFHAYGDEKQKAWDRKVMGSWKEFEAMLQPELASEDALRELTYVPHGGQYYVERRAEDPFWGCVKFTSSSLINAGKPIHGDYDLYDLVPLETPSVNIRATGEMAGQKHARGKYFLDVQNWVNGAIGYPMILHGSQAKYADSHEVGSGVIVFFPDGRLLHITTNSEISRLYRAEFEGRSLFQQQIADKSFQPYQSA